MEIEHEVILKNATKPAELPKALRPLFLPRRYKIMYGGRGGGKSWSVARALLLMGTNKPLRILCAREVQKTISDSVHHLLKSQIEEMGLGGFYTVKETSIVGRHDDWKPGEVTEFVFTGLRSQDAHKIKSFEAVDICWCEEAQAISKKSWDILIPTIRKEVRDKKDNVTWQAEIWITFNPELDTDETYQRFVVNPPPNAWVRKLNWDENPWFPNVLEQERAALQKQDPEEHDHIWGGNPRAVVAGAIYHREMMDMMNQGRIRPVPYDPMLKVHTVWDLGWNDQTSILFVQRQQSEVRIIDYWEGSFKTIAEWASELGRMRYVWGKDWLPHDGATRSVQTGKSSQEILRKLGRRVQIIPRMGLEEGIKAVRMMMPRLYVNDGKSSAKHDGGYELDYVTGTDRLLECLKRYRRKIPTTTEEPASPIHDEYSHGADALRGLAVIVDKLTNDDRPKLRVRHHAIHDAVVGY